ncbi:unnamed protein product [Rotaria sordida]|uniref:DH domain-containing protein n=1 Tax=Rotaria sordida TaxID=392033 RepID=A0A814YX27_9BILA|nr:unnamed protein product [Rotaria sordida]
MEDQLLLSDNTDDDQAQDDGSSSSITSDNENSHRLASSFTSFLSNEDINKCLYVTNINWKRRFSIRLSNGQLDNLSYDRRERIYSDSSTDDINFNRTNPLYLSRYRNSCWFRYRTSSSSSSFNEYNSSNLNDKISSLNSTTVYDRLKRFTERLLELERKARQTVFENKCDKKISSKTDNSIEKINRSSKKNDDQLTSNINQQCFEKKSFHLRIQKTLNINSKVKIRRIKSYPQLKKKSSNYFPLRKIKTMSAIKLLTMESQPHSSSILPFPITKTNILQERSTPVVTEKRISFEVNRDGYNRKVELKTKQEETICTTKKATSPMSPSIVTRIIKTEPPISPSCVTVNQRRPSSTSNSSVQSVRVSVSSSPHRKESDKSVKTKFSFPSPTKITLNEENLVEPSKLDEEETFDRRPLLDLISELNRRHTLNQSSSTIPPPPPPIDNNDQSIKTRTLSPSPTDIRPPKLLSPFRPVIVHRKYQEPIGRFEFVDSSGNSSLSSGRRNSRVSVIRSHTFNNPNNVNSSSMKISSDEIKSNENITCQSTPELSCSNERERDRNRSVVNIEEACGLSANGTILTSTSLTGLTPTSSGTTDDKNETSHSSPIIRASTPIPNDQPLISKLAFYAVRRHHSEPQQDGRWQQAKRKAIAMQMYDTEKSYVEALKNLVTKYYLPMKDKTVISNDLLNDIFYKIPEIHIHHTAFLISLSQKLSEWDNKQTVGDLLLQMFTRTSVIETYTSFVNNYKTAQIAIRLCRDSSSFNKFLEHQARDHRGKLTLRDLIIQPVQRIPRYELYIKDFLKCTNLNHPDYQLLLKAQSEIHSLAEQIDQVQKDVGSTELTVTNNSLEVVQDMIENLNDLVNADRYYIRHDVVTFQSPSGLKKDRYIFLFNDLVIITSCKRRSGTLTKKPATSVIVNSPSGKQYLDNAKHKLIMKISLESIDLAADHLKKRATPPSMIKFHSTTSTSGDKCRHLEDDVLTLGQMTDLAKTITVPHQLDESIKEVLHTVNKHLTDETTSMTNIRTASPEPITLDHNQQKSNNIQLTIHTTERTETIDVLFSSSELKAAWEKSFLEAKKALFEVAAGRRNISFQNVLTLPHSRPGSQFLCGTPRLSLGDICICNSEGQVCLVNVQSDVTLKACNTVISSRINCVAYVPPHKGRRTGSSIKQHQHKQKQQDDERQENKHGFIVKQEPISISNNSDVQTTVDSLLDIDSSDDEDTLTTINNEDIFSLDQSDQTISSQQCILLESDINNEQQDTREATMWLGTDDGIILIFQCTETMKTVARKSRIVKQLGSAIHSILFTDNKVFVALSHGELGVFRRDMSGRWELDCPTIRSVEESSIRHGNGHGEIDDGDNTDPISVMALAAGRLWCAIRDRIYVVCPNSLNVEHSFLVDDCHRHVCSIATGGSSMHHVWIASQGSHEIRLYHATHFVCLLEISIRTAVTQKLQVCDDIIRAHKLGCLRVSALHVCKETLWVGTSAGVIITITVPQLIDSGNNKLTASSLQLKGLSFGHAGPVRFIISTDTTLVSTSEEATSVKTIVLSIGDGFEDYTNNDETLGKDDALSHVIVWQL